MNHSVITYVDGCMEKCLKELHKSIFLEKVQLTKANPGISFELYLHPEYSIVSIIILSNIRVLRFLQKFFFICNFLLAGLSVVNLKGLQPL